MSIPKQLRLLSLLGVFFGLSACSNTGMFALEKWFPDEQGEHEQTSTQAKGQTKNGIRYRQTKRTSKQTSAHSERRQERLVLMPHQNLYRPSHTHKSLSNYAEQLAMQLMQNTRKLNERSLVGVASFVQLDASLQRTNALGNQLAELFIAEVQEYGMSVVDFKLTGGLEIGRGGDYVFSRDSEELAVKLAMDYVLSGTMIENEKGVKVNARIISTKSRVVVSSAKVFIPRFVVDSVQPRVITVQL